MSKTGSNFLLTVAILVGAVIVSAAVAFVIIRKGPPTDPRALPPPANGIVLVQQEMEKCETGDTCIVEDTSCGICCHYVAINANSESVYETMFSESCRNYRGKICGCTDINAYPACINGKCTLVKW